MRSTRTRIVLFGAGGLLVAGAAWPAIALAADSPRAAPAALAQAAHPSGPHGGGLRADGSVAALAKELGVTEEKLRAALDSIRAERRPAEGTRPSTPPDRDPGSAPDRDPGSAPDRDPGSAPNRDPGQRDQAFAAALAAKLGLSEDKVTAALEKVRAQEQEARRTERTTRLNERLDKAVADGKLTQAEADAVRKAAGAGVLWDQGR